MGTRSLTVVTERKKRTCSNMKVATIGFCFLLLGTALATPPFLKEATCDSLKCCEATSTVAATTTTDGKNPTDPTSATTSKSTASSTSSASSASTSTTTTPTTTTTTTTTAKPT